MPLENSAKRPDQRVATLGRSLVAQLFVLLKTSLNYSEGHAALEAPLSNVLKVTRQMPGITDDTVLRLKGDHLYLGEVRLKHDAAAFEAGRFVMSVMRRHFVGGISFDAEVTADDLRRFVYALREVDGRGAPENYSTLLLRMQQRMILHIEVEMLPDQSESVEVSKDKLSRLENGKLKAKMLYRKALSAMEEVMNGAGSTLPIRLREPKRVVQRMIDLLAAHESYLVGLTTLRGSDGGAQNHAVNVCILSLVLGKRLGMSKFQQCELGMAALFHDIGKGDLPRELLEKQGELSAAEQQLMEAHPMYGVKKIMKSTTLDVMTSRIITGIFEHHLLADFSGYPRIDYRRLSLFGRIISIADCYDGMVSRGVSGRTPYAPDKALRLMMTMAGKAYDAPLLKLFISCVGMHGIGSLLLLDNGELALVVENNPHPSHWENPRVKVVADANGGEVDGEVVDLALPECRRGILASLDPRPFNFDVSRYFL